MAATALPSVSNDERRRVLELVYRHGFNATSFQTLEQGFRYSFHGANACVAYVDTGKAWVAAGAPLAATGDLLAVTRTFVDRARASGRRACFFATEERLRRALDDTIASIRIGEQPVYDPERWPTTLRLRRSLREQLRRARAKGVRIRQLPVSELLEIATHERVASITRRWFSSHGLPAMDFLVRVEPFSFPDHRAFFAAEIGDQLVGFAGVVPVPARAGFLLEDLIRDPSAPNGTAELLIDRVMEFAVESRSRFVTLGLAPLAGELSPALRLARKSGAFLYDFDGIRAFRGKLLPDSWSSVYLSYPRSQPTLPSLLDALAAFAGGSLTRFGLRSLWRRFQPNPAAQSLGSSTHRTHRVDARCFDRRQQTTEHADQRASEQRNAE